LPHEQRLQPNTFTARIQHYLRPFDDSSPVHQKGRRMNVHFGHFKLTHDSYPRTTTASTRMTFNSHHPKVCGPRRVYALLSPPPPRRKPIFHPMVMASCAQSHRTYKTTAKSLAHVGFRSPLHMQSCDVMGSLLKISRSAQVMDHNT
jgi:hypothetical protein